MSPVVAGSRLQRFPRTSRLADRFLSLAVQFVGLHNHPFLQALLLLVAFGLLAAVVLGDLHKLMLGPGHRAEDTFVVG